MADVQIFVSAQVALLNPWRDEDKEEEDDAEEADDQREDILCDRETGADAVFGLVTMVRPSYDE